jgi:hypothetical protein
MKFFRTVAVVAALLLVSTIGFAQEMKTTNLDSLKQAERKRSADENLQAEKKKQEIKTENAAPNNTPTEEERLKMMNNKESQKVMAENNAEMLIGREISIDLFNQYTKHYANFQDYVIYTEDKKYIDYNDFLLIEKLKKEFAIKDDYDKVAFQKNVEVSKYKIAKSEFSKKKAGPNNFTPATFITNE